MKKKWLTCLITLVLAVVMAFGGTITVFADENDATEGELLWSYMGKHDPSYVYPPKNIMSPPVYYDGNVYYVQTTYGSDSAIMKITVDDKGTTTAVQVGDKFSGKVTGYVSPEIDGSKMYIPMQNGTIIIADLISGENETIALTNNTASQINTPITFNDDYIYAGAAYGEKGYYRVDKNTKDVNAIVDSDGTALQDGFYWAGAAQMGKYIVFGSEKGYVYSCKNTKNEFRVVDKLDATEGSSTKIRASIVVDSEGNGYFTTQNGKKVFKISVDANGEISKLWSSSLTVGFSVGAPVINDGKLYVGNGKVNNGVIDIFDLQTGELESTVRDETYLTGNVQALTVNEGKVFATYNNKPGGIYNVSEKEPYFVPSEAMQEYNAYLIATDNNGTMYFRNDSGYIMAVKSDSAETTSYKATVTVGTNGKVDNTEYTVKTDGTLNIPTTPNKGYKPNAAIISGSANVSYDGNTVKLTGITGDIQLKIDFVKSIADTIDVYVSVADSGEFVTAKDGKTLLSNVEISVNDINKDGAINVDEVLYAAHENYYEGGALAGYKSSIGGYGLAINVLWGDNSGCFGYWINKTSCYSLADEVKDGDYVKAFIYNDKTNWSDIFTSFEKNAYTGTSGQATTIKLLGAGYDDSWNTVFTGFEGADISVIDNKTGKEVLFAVTDKYGEAVLNLDAGSYTAIATKKDGSIVPSGCLLTVSSESVEATNTQTGDDFNVILFGIAAVISLIAAAAVLATRKSRA